MAFSTSELQYLDALFNSYYANGYKYYVAYTNTVSSSSSSTGTPDMIAYFSKDEITTSGYGTFSIPANSVKCSVVVSDYYQNYGQSQYIGSRLITTVVSAQSLDVPDYEHIYSNAVGTAETIALTPNPYATEVKQNEITFTCAALLCCIMLFSVFCRIFFRS